MTTATTQATERIKQRFKLYDVDHNGKIERSDLEAEAKRIIKAFGENENSDKGRATREAYMGLWEYMADKTGVGSRGSVTLEQFTDFTQKHVIAQGAAGYARVLRPAITAMLQLADTDDDGKLNPSEFTKCLDAIGVDRTSADESFRKMDANRDGYVDTDELVNAMREYHEGRLDVPLLGR
jgi:Ca2+-binding EF-hand superfamily protein